MPQIEIYIRALQYFIIGLKPVNFGATAYFVIQYVPQLVRVIKQYCPPALLTYHYYQSRSKGSVSQLMDDLDFIIEQVEVMVNSIQKGVENVLRK